jgi:hypothetical protein
MSKVSTVVEMVRFAKAMYPEYGVKCDSTSITFHKIK